MHSSSASSLAFDILHTHLPPRLPCLQALFYGLVVVV